MNGVWEKYVFSSRLETRLKRFAEAAGGNGCDYIFVERQVEPVQDEPEELADGSDIEMKVSEVEAREHETENAAIGNLTMDLGVLSQPLTSSQVTTGNQRATSFVTEKLGKYDNAKIIAQLKSASDAVLLQFCSCVCCGQLREDDHSRAMTILCQTLLQKLQGEAEVCSRATLVAAQQAVEAFPQEACSQLLLPLLQSPVGAAGEVLAGLGADTRADLLRLFAASAGGTGPLSAPQLAPLQSLLCPGLDPPAVDALAALLAASAPAFLRSAAFGKLLVAAAESLGPVAGPEARRSLEGAVAGHRSLQRRLAEKALQR